MKARIKAVASLCYSCLELLNPAREGSAYISRVVTKRSQTFSLPLGLRGKMLLVK